tara:strand:+ start:4653 stop:6032 length:1380 start_codon:yes stop_codon:yes gene_type:complete
MQNNFDLIVIGGGSGGIATARRAAEYGARVALVESGKLGGTCVNLGCVPKKIMWNAARISGILEDASDYGFSINKPDFDWKSLVAERDAYITRLNEIYRKNLESAGVLQLSSIASLVDVNHVLTNMGTLNAPHILIATGGKPTLPSLAGVELGITSDKFFELSKQPMRVLIVGSGYIATELAGMLNALGSEVTIVIRKNTLLRDFDISLTETLMTEMKKNGINILTNINVEAIEKVPDGTMAATYSDGSSTAGLDTAIWAIGREPETTSLNLDGVGVDTDSDGHILTDAYQNTNIDGIYAVGDVIGHHTLTPVAIAAGRRLADRVFGGKSDAYLDYENIPSVIFSHPPIGTVGLTEKQAVERHGLDAVTIYEGRFTNIYYAMTKKKAPTIVKLIVIGDEEIIVGCHVIGEAADELIQGFAVTITMGARKADFDKTVAIHPTAAEELVTLRNGRKSNYTA